MGELWARRGVAGEPARGPQKSEKVRCAFVRVSCPVGGRAGLWKNQSTGELLLFTWECQLSKQISSLGANRLPMELAVLQAIAPV